MLRTLEVFSGVARVLPLILGSIGMPNLIVKIKRNQKFEHDKTEDGWELLRPGAPVPDDDFSLEFVPVLIGEEKEITGSEMFRRAILNKCSSQCMLDYLLKNSKVIPMELQGKVLVFAATLWLDGGYLRVPCLYWCGGEWCPGFYFLDGDWHSSGVFVRLGA